MAKADHDAIQFDDQERHRLHLVWSRSGKHLIVTACTDRWEDPHQVELTPDQVSHLIVFLTDTLDRRSTDR